MSHGKRAFWKRFAWALLILMVAPILVVPLMIWVPGGRLGGRPSDLSILDAIEQADSANLLSNDPVTRDWTLLALARNDRWEPSDARNLASFAMAPGALSDSINAQTFQRICSRHRELLEPALIGALVKRAQGAAMCAMPSAIRAVFEDWDDAYGDAFAMSGGECVVDMEQLVNVHARANAPAE